MDERIELFQKARKLGIIGALLGLAIESGAFVFILDAVIRGYSLIDAGKINPINPFTVFLSALSWFAWIIYLLLLYFAVRNIGKVLREFIFSTYFGAANITFFIPFVSYFFRGKSLKALGKALQNDFFLISSYLYFIATPLAFFSIAQFDIRPLNIVFKIIATLAYALALFGLAFILLGFLYFPESPKPAASINNI
jgi:hypothetical protein